MKHFALLFVVLISGWIAPLTASSSERCEERLGLFAPPFRCMIDHERFNTTQQCEAHCSGLLQQTLAVTEEKASSFLRQVAQRSLGNGDFYTEYRVSDVRVSQDDPTCERFNRLAGVARQFFNIEESDSYVATVIVKNKSGFSSSDDSSGIVVPIFEFTKTRDSGCSAASKVTLGQDIVRIRADATETLYFTVAILSRDKLKYSVQELVQNVAAGLSNNMVGAFEAVSPVIGDLLELDSEVSDVLVRTIPIKPFPARNSDNVGFSVVLASEGSEIFRFTVKSEIDPLGAIVGIDSFSDAVSRARTTRWTNTGPQSITLERDMDANNALPNFDFLGNDLERLEEYCGRFMAYANRSETEISGKSIEQLTFGILTDFRGQRGLRRALRSGGVGACQAGQDKFCKTNGLQCSTVADLVTCPRLAPGRINRTVPEIKRWLRQVLRAASSGTMDESAGFVGPGWPEAIGRPTDWNDEKIVDILSLSQPNLQCVVRIGKAVSDPDYECTYYSQISLPQKYNVDGKPSKIWLSVDADRDGTSAISIQHLTFGASTDEIIQENPFTSRASRRCSSEWAAGSSGDLN